MKLIINKCYGGFGLSHEGILRYLALKGITHRLESTDWGYLYHLSENETFDEYNLDRTDPALVQVVEELGEAANGYCAALEVRDLHSGQQYRIRDYDGREWLEFPFDIAWEIAT